MEYGYLKAKILSNIQTILLTLNVSFYGVISIANKEFLSLLQLEYFRGTIS